MQSGVMRTRREAKSKKTKRRGMASGRCAQQNGNKYCVCEKER